VNWRKPIWQMLRKRNASALESWLEGATESGIPELRTFATGIKRDQAAILAALTYGWNQGPVEGQINRLKLDLSPSVRTSRV
jgi:transposase